MPVKNQWTETKDRLEKEVAALRAHVESLRQGLLMSNCEITECDYSDDDVGIKELIEENLRIVDSTPAQSLATYRNEVIEECAVKCNAHKEKFIEQGKQTLEACTHVSDCECGEYDQAHITAANMLRKEFEAMKDEGVGES